MSSPNSTKGTLFKQKLSAKPIKYRDCEPEDLVISDCLSEIKKEIENDEDAVLIGSSLGGFLAAKTALENENVKQIILLNPAIIPLSVDITKIDGMPQSILSDIQDESLFKSKISSDIYILIGLQDDVVPIKWPLEFAMSQNSTIKFFEDDHSFTKNLQKLPQIINKIIMDYQ
ncbi:hypothetical protein AYK21_04395 [Thermoplasmatales archaeon SG8-52-2]|nr:MAG: hypothetical protein AYK21_04395 [Thermoplasmatales archaeon SG8-52-2]